MLFHSTVVLILKQPFIHIITHKMSSLGLLQAKTMKFRKKLHIVLDFSGIQQHCHVYFQPETII